jgi:hypothetical protein
MALGSFLWGSGGRRMSPDEIARERALAARRMQGDYSPVSHWSQGLGRVADNLVGALDSRRADSASEANASDSRRIIEALMNPSAASPAQPPLDSGPAGTGQVSGVVSGLSDTAPAGAPAGRPPINPAIMEAMTSPYVSDEVRALATRQYQDATRRAQPIEVNGRIVDPSTMQVLGDFSSDPEIIRLVRASGVDPASETGRAMIARAVEARVDPIVTVPLPGGRTYVGPRSGLPGSVGTGQAPPPTLPPDFNFDEEGGPQASSPAGGFSDD